MRIVEHVRYYQVKDGYRSRESIVTPRTDKKPADQ